MCIYFLKKNAPHILWAPPGSFLWSKSCFWRSHWVRNLSISPCFCLSTTTRVTTSNKQHTRHTVSHRYLKTPHRTGTDPTGGDATTWKKPDERPTLRPFLRCSKKLLFHAFPLCSNPCKCFLERVFLGAQTTSQKVFGALGFDKKKLWVVELRCFVKWWRKKHRALPVHWKTCIVYPTQGVG